MTFVQKEESFRMILLTSSYPSSSDKINNTFMTDLAESLIAKDIRVFVICPHQPNLPFRENQNNITIIRYPYWFTKSGERLGGVGGIIASINRSPLAVIQLLPFCICQFLITCKTVRKENINLIHSHWIIPQGFIGAFIHFFTGIPHIISIHGTDIYLIHSHKWAHLWMRLIVNYSDFITANSSYTHQLIQDIVSSGKKKSKVIPMGIQLSNFIEHKSSSQSIRKKILFVGRLITLKGIHNLIKAIKIVETKYFNIQLIIIGDGPKRGELEKLSHDLRLSSIIFFLGNLDRQTLLSYYENADLLVLPSINHHHQSEGLGVVLLEAMAAGVPVIGSNTGGIPDIIIDKVNGLLVPPGDPHILAEAIIQIFENPEFAEKLKKAGLKTVNERFSWDIVSGQFVDIYKMVLNEYHT